MAVALNEQVYGGNEDNIVTKRVHMGHKRREIWMVDLGPTVGSVQGGIRPCLIYQNDVGNRFSPTTKVIPISSSSTKAKIPTHVDIPASPESVKYNSIAMAEQIKTIDTDQLMYRLGRINDDDLMKKIDTAYLVSGGLEHLIPLMDLMQ